MIFIIGFSQGFYIVFLACQRVRDLEKNSTQIQYTSYGGDVPNENILAVSLFASLGPS
jgi:hypothetical protein